MAAYFWVFTALYIYTSNSSPITTISSLKIIASLTTTQQLHDGETLVSPNQRFEFGFFCPSNPCKDVKFLGIWYKNLSPITVVWVGNRKKPIRRPSPGVHLVLDESGVFSIQDASKKVIWRKVPKGHSSSLPRKPVLQLLDSGNLVVHACINSPCGSYIWESFNQPGDTLLPGMELSIDYGSPFRYRAITSWRKKDDPSDGDFKFGFDKLVQAPQLVLTKENGVRLSRWGPWDGQKFSGMNSLMDNPIMSPSLTFDEDTVSLKFEALNDSILLRFVLSPLGSLQFLWWKSKNEGWLTILTLNKDNCDRIGSCGSYGICYSDDPSCRCLEKGFMAISSVDWCGFECSSGCKRKIDLNCTEGDGFLKYEEMKLPDNATVWGALSTKECEDKCAKECNCIAYTSLNLYGNGSICVVWFDDLIDLRMIHGGGNDLYIRMSHIELDSIVHTKRKKVKLVAAIVLLPTISCVLLLAIIIRFVSMLRRSKTKASGRDHSSLSEFGGSQEENSSCRLFELEEISAATNNFSTSNEIGEGGFGRVYKGELARGEEVAVKRLAESSWQGIREFKNEVTLIAKLQHRNLVKLLGYCIEGTERILIYEYLPNHSLDQIIFDQVKKRLLLWDDRFKIIKGVAKGLLYLHDDSRLRIIHRDLKASNILLDREMNPKISDFGLARILASEKEETTNRVIGTHGYMSPEYIMNGQFSTKSDVYSFGVLALEIISGKKNWGFQHPDHNLNLLGHAWKLWTEGRCLELMDPVLGESVIQDDEVVKCIHIGLLCVQKKAEDRPTMSEVVNMQQNENFVSLHQPNEPGFYAGRSLIGLGFSTTERLDLDSINEVTMTTLTGR
ncbi:G-type lectin S-receptor-like serine/threonine-protein kinase At4g27290 [Cynara cardunculus var. scolymus]|uniref:Receptor-like serine/threonine-protein kinase n=1 Tax=Cynara cardunculus var. scolymus TaxID=59895 RepID=A0A124SDG2_CYNCS|nr:G-type lectin S-receptor-like serine/threonine-protein kinase At4g27290 [Cynara cardunculus var. scolymus]KVH96832.1 Apple-like protein [Cynara cardunculus var. scolymus]